MHIVDVIDRLLEEPKVLASAKVVFAQGNQTADQRCEWPVLVDGVLADCYIACTAYPLEDELRFTITLTTEIKIFGVLTMSLAIGPSTTVSGKDILSVAAG